MKSIHFLSLLFFVMLACDRKPYIEEQATVPTQEDVKYVRKSNEKNLLRLAKIKASENTASMSFPTQVVKDSLPYGELVYIPAYSEIYSIAHHRTELLSTTLSIHNVNLEDKIYITRLEYYDTNGKLLKEVQLKDLPLPLKSLATKNYIIDFYEKEGGVGANFVLEWRSTKDVISPLIETIMINTQSNWGLSFTSNAKVIKTYKPLEKMP